MANSKASVVAAVAAHAGLQLLSVLFWGPTILLLAWLAFFGTENWRTDAYWRTFPPDFGCDDSKLLDLCTLKQLAFLWLAPAVLAFAALSLLVLHAILEKHSHRSGAAAQWASILLPPRYGHVLGFYAAAATRPALDILLATSLPSWHGLYVKLYMQCIPSQQCNKLHDMNPCNGKQSGQNVQQ